MVKRVAKKKAVSNPFDVVSDIPDTGYFIMIYGDAGSGKTSLAGQFEKPLFVITHGENGIYHLKKKKIVPSTVDVIELAPEYNTQSLLKHQYHPGWEKAVSTATTFAKSKHPYKTLIYDTTSGLESLCYQHCAMKLFGGDMDATHNEGFMSYQKGYDKAGEKFWKPEFINACLDCAKAGYNVVLLAHTNTKTSESNLIGEDFERSIPDLRKPVWKRTKKDIQGCFYMGERITVQKTKSTVKPVGSVRFIGVSNETWYYAKNWYNLKSTIPQGENPSETYSKLAKVLF